MASSDGLDSHLSSQESGSSSLHSRRKRVKPHAKIKLTTTNVQFEANHDAFRDIRRLLELFHDYSIPGPLLVRTKTDFSLEVGSGGQGLVRAASEEYTSSLNNLTPMPVEPGSIWPNYASQERCISHWQSCVIKQLRSKTQTLENEAASAVREVYSLCQASKVSARSKHIVKLLGWGICLDALESKELSNSKLPFLVLERATCDMEQFIMDGRHEVEDDDSRMRIALDIGKGLFAIHIANMAHGDMKLSNILMFLDGNRNWSVKICDFGSASDGEHYKLRGQYNGTDTWRPPEAFYNRAPVDLRSCDIFTYGLVIWSWFLGRDTSPIEDLEADQIIKARGKQQYYRLALEDVVEKYGESVDLKWLDRYRKDHSDRADDNKPDRTKKSRFCGVWFPETIDSLNEVPTRDFKSMIVNRILNALAVALDEAPIRRSAQPWDYFQPSVSVRAPVPPRPFEQRNQEAKLVSIERQEQNRDLADFLDRLKQRMIVSMTQVLQHLSKPTVFLFENWLLVFAGGKYRLTVFRNFHYVFYDALGGDIDDVTCVQHNTHQHCVQLTRSSINTLRRLIHRDHSGGVVDRCHDFFSSLFADYSQLPDASQWHQETLYAVARLRSRFVDQICWQNLFVLDPDLRSSIDQAVSYLRLSSIQPSAAWAFRNVTALDIPTTEHTSYFTFLKDMSLSEEERTFRMHLLLERGFFLGQSIDDSPNSPTVFWYYLTGLYNTKLALTVCQHFRRIASLDGVHDLCKFYYTGLSDPLAPLAQHEYLNTCLHDAIKALNPSVAGYLLKTDFDNNALDGNEMTALDVLNEDQDLEIKMLSAAKTFHSLSKLKQRRLELRVMLTKRWGKLSESGLPQGWHTWRTSSIPAFVETSIKPDFDLDATDPHDQTYSYPITFKRPHTGFYQNSVIALVARQISETEKEPYLFNPLRFLRLQNQIDTGSEPAKMAHFSIDWYTSDAMALRQLLEKNRLSYMPWQTAFWSNFSSTIRSYLRGDSVSETWYLFAAYGFTLLFPLLSVIAMLDQWSSLTQFWICTLGLSRIYARVWTTLTKSRVCESLRILSFFETSIVQYNLKVGDVGLDCLHIVTVLLLDLMVALFFLFRLSPLSSLAFVAGSITYSYVLVFGATAIVAGLKYYRFRFNEGSLKALCGTGFFSVFTILFVLTMKLHESGPLRTEHWLTVSRAAALISVVLFGWLGHFTLKSHRDLFSEFDEDIRELVTGQEIRTSEQRPHPLYRTTLDVVMLVVLGVMLTNNLSTSILNLSQDDAFEAPGFSSRINSMLILVLVPCITKLFITSELMVLAFANQSRSVLMRSIGVSVGIGLLVLPTLIIAGWCSGKDIGYDMPAWHALFLFLQWLLYIRLLFQASSTWFTGVVLMGFYSVFVMCAYLSV